MVGVLVRADELRQPDVRAPHEVFHDAEIDAGQERAHVGDVLLRGADVGVDQRDQVDERRVLFRLRLSTVATGGRGFGRFDDRDDSVIVERAEQAVAQLGDSRPYDVLDAHEPVVVAHRVGRHVQHRPVVLLRAQVQVLGELGQQAAHGHPRALVLVHVAAVRGRLQPVPLAVRHVH